MRSKKAAVRRDGAVVKNTMPCTKSLGCQILGDFGLSKQDRVVRV